MVVGKCCVPAKDLVGESASAAVGLMTAGDVYMKIHVFGLIGALI